MSGNHQFTACKYLDFKGEYYNCRKEILGTGKVFWMRNLKDKFLPIMVQFCTKRGRLNHPESCTEKRYARCSDYEEVEHSVPIDEIF